MSNNKYVCPWLRGEYCISPMLPRPDNTITGRHCFDKVGSETCRFYTEPETEEEPKGLEKYLDKHEEREQKLVYDPIHALELNFESPCDYISVESVGDKKYVYCKVIQRMLVKSQAELCKKYSTKCPYRSWALLRL